MRDFFRGTNESEDHYQPETNLGKDENCYLNVYSHNILKQWELLVTN
jgi:hypothetical protein